MRKADDVVYIYIEKFFCRFLITRQTPPVGLKKSEAKRALIERSASANLEFYFFNAACTACRMPISNEIIVSGFMTLSPWNQSVLQYVEKSCVQVGQEMDDGAGVRQKLLDRFVPNAEAVDFDETAGLGYGLSASDGIVWGAIREHYQDFPGFRLPA